MAAIDGTEHRARIGFVYRAAAEGNELIQAGSRHHACCRPRRAPAAQSPPARTANSPAAAMNFRRSPIMAADSRLRLNCRQARQHGHGQFLRVPWWPAEIWTCGRRLFQRFEQCVERMGRQHVDFVDEVHLCSDHGSARIARCRAYPGCHRPWCARAASTSRRSTKTAPRRSSRHAAHNTARIGTDSRRLAIQ